MDQLNKNQQLAAQAGDGPVVIVAGPGTGKTKTLTARITYLIESQKARPQEILALTFTKKAAQEMRQRLGKLAPPNVLTFHALCSKLLGGEHEFISEPERLALIKSLPKPAVFKGLSTRELALKISRAKNLADDSPDTERFLKSYNEDLKNLEKIDFDDLLWQTRELLKANPNKKPYFKYILVDEFQDTNRLQYELLCLLKSNNNLFVIGDPNQSIYGFRGASGGIFDQFRADFPGSQIINLSINYRSSPRVVSLSNAIFDLSLHANSQVPGRVSVTEVLNEYSEASWVLNKIQQAIGGADLLKAVAEDQRRCLRDFAIVYRSRRVATVLQKLIDESGLPYQIVGDGSPYERQDVQMLLSLLHCCAGQLCPVIGFSEIQVQELLKKLDSNQPPSKLAQQLVDVFKINSSCELSNFIGTLVRFKDLKSAINHLDAIAGQQFYDPSADAITLLTIHAAKGLEFVHVFLIGAEEGVLPDAKADIQEEKRLFYVAATRAKEQLDITYVQKRRNHNAKVSRFAAEIPNHVLPRLADPNLAADQRRAKKRQIKRSQLSFLQDFR